MSEGICLIDRDLGRALTDEEILELNTYDFLAHLGKRVINPGGLTGQKKLLEILHPEPGSHLLEIGCGTGHAACDIAERYRCRVTAIDVSPWMVRTAREVAKSRGLSEQVRFDVGDI